MVKLFSIYFLSGCDAGPLFHKEYFIEDMVADGLRVAIRPLSSNLAFITALFYTCGLREC